MATTGSAWLLLNYIGELYTASPLRTPVLSAIGGLNGGKLSQNFTFPVSAEYSIPAAAQTTITEDDSVDAPTAVDVVTTQVYNVCEIHHHSILVTYQAISNQNRLSGITGPTDNLASPASYDFQIKRKLEEIARDVEFSILQGTYVVSTGSGVANGTRGLIECASDAGNTVAAGGATLTKPVVQELLRTMYAAGAIFANAAFIVNAFQKQVLSEIYGYAPTSRDVGGLNIQQIETDFGLIGVILDSFQPAATVTLAELSVCAPVFQEVPKKGGLFYQPLAPTGAADKGQLYGQIGLDHGPKWMHGTITGCATS